MGPVAVLLAQLATAAAGAEAATPAGTPSPATPMVKVPAGTVILLLDADKTPRPVAAFQLDETAVTNAQFRDFVRRHPRWARSRVKRLFADEGYLAHWSSDEDLGPRAAEGAPVTQVSWFAARAYCQARGARLPTLTEWELVARADEIRADASGDDGFHARILGWYAAATTLPLPPVKSTYRNVYGAWDLHGLVWEWVDDFGAVLSTGESRDKGDISAKMFCGAGGASSANPADYAAFMRYALRGSVTASHTQGSLGFRCARDLP